MKFFDIYVSITGYLFQVIKIHGCRLNSQHFMSAHLVFHDISIDTKKQERFLKIMLADGVYITFPLN